MRWVQNHGFLLLYVTFTLASQLIMRWRVGFTAVSPENRIGFIVAMLMTPWVWVAIACTFLAGVTWMLALTRFELTYAFPFTGMTFILVLAAGALLFGEHVGYLRILGTLLVVAGLVIVMRS